MQVLPSWLNGLCYQFNIPEIKLVQKNCSPAAPYCNNPPERVVRAKKISIFIGHGFPSLRLMENLTRRIEQNEIP
jgi:hypothetical protein